MTHYLVRNDTAAAIQSTLTKDNTGEVIDVLNDTVYLKVRLKNTGTVLFTLTGFGTPSELSNGVVTFAFSNNMIDIASGYYEGEIEINYLDTTVETVYELVNIKIRDDL